MTDPDTPPSSDVPAGEPGVQHPTGYHYVQVGGDVHVLNVQWSGDKPLVQFRLGTRHRFEHLPDGARVLGQVPMPPAGDPGPSGDRLGPTQVLDELVRRAYDSGVSAGSTGLPAHLQQTAKTQIRDNAAASLGAMFAAGDPPLNSRSIDLLSVVTAVVDESVALGVRRGDGQGGYADYGLTGDLCAVTSRALAALEPLLTRPNPHHPTERLRTYGQDDYVSWNGENAALRRTLLWLAGRAEVTAETRRLLRERIQTGADRVVADTQEDEHVQVLDFRKIVDELCTLVEAAVACEVREKSHADSEVLGRLPPYWNARAANRAEMLRSALEDLPEIHTLAGLRFA